MKGKFQLLKMSLVGLFLTAALGVSAQVTPTTPGVTYLCEGETVVLTAPDGFDSFQWFYDENGSTTPDAAPGTSTEKTYVATETGYYYLQVWNSGDGCLSPISDGYPIYILPALSVNITAVDGDFGYCEDVASTGITLTAEVSNPAGVDINYQWYSSTDALGADRAPIADEDSQTLQITEAGPGTYYYDVVVSYGVDVEGTEGACNATSSIQAVTVTAMPSAPTIEIVSTP